MFPLVRTAFILIELKFQGIINIPWNAYERQGIRKTKQECSCGACRLLPHEFDFSSGWVDIGIEPRGFELPSGELHVGGGAGPYRLEGIGRQDLPNRLGLAGTGGRVGRGGKVVQGLEEFTSDEVLPDIFPFQTSIQKGLYRS